MKTTPKNRKPQIPRHKRGRAAGDPALQGADRGLAEAATHAVLPPLLKPYGGVGDGFLQKRGVTITGVIAALICLPFGFYYALFTPWLIMLFIAPLAILILIVIWALPDTKALAERPMEWLTFLFTAALSLWPNYLALALPGLPWVTITRLVTTPLCLLLLVSISSSPLFRARMAGVLNATPLLWKAMAAFVLIQVISLPFSINIAESINKFVVHLTNETAMFFLSAYVFRRRGRVIRWVFLLWSFAMVDCAIGLIEYLREKPLWGDSVPPFLAIQDPFVLNILAGNVRSNTGQYRTVSIFSTSLGCSEYLAFVMPFVLHIAASPTYRFWTRMGALASLPVMVLTILATDSRLGLLGTFLTMMIYLFIWSYRLWRQNKRSLLGPTVIALYPVIFIGLVIASFAIGRVRAKVWGTGQYDDSNEARKEQVRAAIPKIISHPLGHGVGMGGDALGFVNPAGVQTIDVYYLVTALEYGFLGFIVFYGFFILSARYAIKDVIFSKVRSRELSFAFPLCISIINFLIIKGVLAQDDNHPLIFMMCGIVCALVYRAKAAAPKAVKESVARRARPSVGGLGSASPGIATASVTNSR